MLGVAMLSEGFKFGKEIETMLGTRNHSDMEENMEIVQVRQAAKCCCLAHISV